MTGICGWLDNSGNYNNQEQHAFIQSMGEVLAGPATLQTENLRQDGDSVAAAIHAEQGETAQHEGLLVSYCGRPWWSDEQLKDIARQRGHAAAIALGYRNHGHKLLEKIHGSFCLAVLDTRANQALIAIDRIGVSPLSYWHQAGKLVFGSNTSAVIAHPAVPSELDKQSIFDYLYFHMVPSPRTIYQGIGKLLPGQYLSLDNGKLTTDFYWQLEYQDNASTPQQALETELQQQLRDAMQRSLGGGKVGAFLSGGIDSSTMAGVLTEVLGQPAQTYSIGFDAEGYDETEFARASAKHFGTNHKEYYLTPQDVVDAIPKIAASYDEPFGNASAVPSYFCAKMAAEDGIDIMIAGDGGDEIFAGNARYAKQGVFEHYQRIPSVLRSNLIEPVALNLPGADNIIPLRKLKSYIEQARVPLPDRLESYNFLHREPLTNIFTDDFLASINNDEPLEICRNAYQRTHSNSILNKMMHLDLKNTLADNDLRKVNRMCQLGGVEVRYPLLDEKLVAFSGRVPVNLKIKGQELRYFFKHSLRDFLAPSTLNKSKHGFGLPFGLWLQEYAPLHDLANESLQSFSQRGYIRKSYIDDLLNKHDSEHASYYGVMIWVIMMLEQWLQSHDQQSTSNR